MVPLVASLAHYVIIIIIIIVLRARGVAFVNTKPFLHLVLSYGEMAREWQYRMSIKCKYMLISRSPNKTLPTSEVELNGEGIERVKVFRYLGVWVSEDLNWSHHILKTTKRASKLIGLIYRRYYMSSSQGTLLLPYLSFVRPIIKYAAPVWDSHYACHIQALEKVQRFALRMSAKLWDNSTCHETLE